MNRIIASIKAHEKKRRVATKACIEALKQCLTEPDKNGKHHKIYLAKLKALKNLNEVEPIYTPTIQDYLAGASSIIDLSPQMSVSSLLDKVVFYKSDKEALLSAWQNVWDEIWTAYFGAEHTILNDTQEQKQK
jgi:hypothetical protein